MRSALAPAALAAAAPRGGALALGLGALALAGRRAMIGALRGLLPFLAPYRWTIVGVAAALLTAAGLTLSLPLALRRVIDGFTAGDFALIDQYFTAVLGVAAALAAATALRFYLVSRLGERVIGADTATAVRRMLEEVVRPGGTGTKAAVDGYRVAGKTGTAWKFASGGYSEDKYISIFAGMAPASDPRLATVVVIDEPGGELYYGSDVAAPVFADVMSESLRLLAVAPDDLPARDAGSIMQAMSQ